MSAEAETVGAVEPKVENQEAQALDVDLSGLKKKKKSKKVSGEGEQEGNDGVEEITDILPELSLKKKKKKSTKDSSTAEETVDAEGELGLKKKKKKKKAGDEFKKQLEKAGVLEDEEKENAITADDSGEPDLTYEELLTRFFTILRENNPEFAGDRTAMKYKIPPPQMSRDGNKKSVFANVQEIAERMQRSPEHVIQYLFAELGTSGSIDGQKRLIIKGRFQQKQIENVLRHYIVEYVTCKTCKSINTEMTKENRLYFLRCKTCGSTRSVSSIKTGFQAHVGRRKRTA